MQKYVENFASIRQDHGDVADYDRFRDCCRAFLQKGGFDGDAVASGLLGALSRLSNPRLVSIVFELLPLAGTASAPEDAVVRRYLGDADVADAVFRYLRTARDRAPFRDVILRYLHDGGHESASFFDLVSHPDYAHNVACFLGLAEPALLRKQLGLRLHTRQFDGIDRFVPLFGSNDARLCFLVFELFTLHCASGRRTRADVGAQAKRRGRVRVESATNFLFYFFDFIEERERVLAAIARGDVDAIAQVLAAYVESSEGLRIDLRIRRLGTHRDAGHIPPAEAECVEEEDFDYLFGAGCRKDACGCVEL